MNSTATKQIKSRKRTSPVRKKKPAARRRAPQKQAEPTRFVEWLSAGAAVEAEVLPNWQDLGVEKGNTKFATPVRKFGESLFDRVSTVQFALFVLAIVFVMGLYVSNVFATQETLAGLERLKRSNIQLQLQYNQMKGQLGREISPSVIYRRAKELGLEEGADYGATIYWSGEEGVR